MTNKIAYTPSKLTQSYVETFGEFPDETTKMIIALNEERAKAEPFYWESSGKNWRKLMWGVKQ